MASSRLWTIQDSPTRERAGSLALTITNHIQQKPRYLQTPIGHRQRFTLVPRPTWRLFYCGQNRTSHARARVTRGESCIDHDRKHTTEPMSTSRPSRSPLSVRFSLQANVATFPLLPTQNSPRARACSPARARGESCMNHRRKHTTEPTITSNANRSPRRVQFRFQANAAPFLLWTIQNSPLACAREEGEGGH